MSRAPARPWRAAAFALALGAAAGANAQLRAFEFQLDNDQFAFTPPSEERWYTSGGFFRFGYDARPGSIEGRIAETWCARVLACDPGSRAMHVLSIGQTMYTPAHTGTTVPQPYDRPYAAALYLGLASVVLGEHSRQTLELQLGAVGPAALGEPVQNAIHSVLGQARVDGWVWQVRAQPLVQLGWSRLARFPLSGGADAVMRTAVRLGNPVTQAGAGVMLRAGLPPTGPTWPGESIGAIEPAGWHVFAGVEGRAVARDALIDGATYAYESRVTREPGAGSAFFGLSFSTLSDWRVDLSWALHSVPFSAPGVAADALRPQRIGTIALRWQPPR